MSHASTPSQIGLPNPFTMGRRGSTKISNVVYRSRAIRPLSPPELHELTCSSQLRNDREAITGLMLYDDNRFYQWLEGPPENVGRLMQSIRNDRRHTDVEILNEKPAEARAFGGWSMKLATPGPLADGWRRDVIEPPREIVDNLRRHPEAAPSLLVKLVAVDPAGAATQAETVAHLPLTRKTGEILRDVFLASILPSLQRPDGAPAAPNSRRPHPRAAELADLLVATDQSAALDLIQELQGSGCGVGPLAATLLEPAARALGDLWREDLCSEFDVTIGLCRLQTAVRLLAIDIAPRPAGRLPQPLVLICPEPGELHRLGAALDSTALQNAGWSPRCEYPEDDHALQDLLSSNWFDVLDLSLSLAFRRDHWLPRVTDTIAEARCASRNPALVVVVGGRIFRDQRGSAATVGADTAVATSHNLNRSILKTLGKAGTPAATPTALKLMMLTPSAS